MPLFKVTVNYETVLVAGSIQDAKAKAKSKECLDDSTIRIRPEELTNLDQLPEHWTPQCQPFGETEGKSIEQHLQSYP